MEEDGVKMVSIYGDKIVHINEKSNTVEIEIQSNRIHRWACINPS